MAAALCLEAHGGALRLAAQICGTHFQGLAACAAHLRRGGCRDRALLRRLAALDAACGVVRHITVVSVDGFLKDLELACLNIVHDDLDVHPEVEPAVVADVTSDETANRGSAPACSEGGSEVVSTKATEETDQDQQAHLGQQLVARVETDHFCVASAAVSETLKDVREVPVFHNLVSEDNKEVGEVPEFGGQEMKDFLLSKWKARMAGRPGFGGADARSPTSSTSSD